MGVRVADFEVEISRGGSVLDAPGSDSGLSFGFRV